MHKYTEAKVLAAGYVQKNKGLQRFKFAICPGNNSNIIRRCMQLREERWEETNSFDKMFNFKWQPFSRGIKFDSVNSFGFR